MACSLAGPLILSFDKKVAFYQKWKYLFPAMLLPAFIYILWDAWFTSAAVWSFNEKYITGIKLANLPVEEVLFFFVVPYCCVFIYECIRCYFRDIKNKSVSDIILKTIAAGLFITGIFSYNKNYTSWTFIGTAIFITVIYLFRNHFKNFDATSFLISFLIVLIPFLLVNGFLTALPVVSYNDAENLGIKIYTIPFEDCFYGMLLMLMNTILYEKLKEGGTTSPL